MPRISAHVLARIAEELIAGDLPPRTRHARPKSKARILRDLMRSDKEVARKVTQLYKAHMLDEAHRTLSDAGLALKDSPEPVTLTTDQIAQLDRYFEESYRVVTAHTTDEYKRRYDEALRNFHATGTPVPCLDPPFPPEPQWAGPEHFAAYGKVTGTQPQPTSPAKEKP